MAKIQQQSGKHGQQMAASYLASIGFLMVEKIGTPVITIPYLQARRKDVYQVVYGEKVSGDHRALLPDGTSVLIETKTDSNTNLRYGRMREHQPLRLSEHAGIGRAMSLLVWVHDVDIYVMTWGTDGIEGFEEGKSITPTRAQALHGEFMGSLKKRMLPPYCVWGVDDDPDGDVWKGTCGIAWVFTDGCNPKDNYTNFCPSCGREIRVMEGIEKEDEDE